METRAAQRSTIRFVRLDAEAIGVNPRPWVDGASMGQSFGLARLAVGAIVIVAGSACLENVDPTHLSESPVVVNEVVASSDVTEDWIELYNNADDAVDLSGWWLTDEKPLVHRHDFAHGTRIEGRGYLIVERAQLSFGLGALDAIWLFDADSDPVDYAEWQDGEAAQGHSFGRDPDGTGPFGTLITPTQGRPNWPRWEGDP